jgi:hypothetical protein
MRLPQDLWAARAPSPALEGYRETVQAYAERYANARSLDDRAEALWGLVARGKESLPWCVARLRSGDMEGIEDAAGVLVWVGVPEDMREELRALFDSLPDSMARDALAETIADEIEEIAEEDDRLGGGGIPGMPLGGACDPFTQEIIFVEVPYEAVVSDPSLLPAGDRSERRGSLRALCGLLEPVTSPPTRVLFIETGPSWTAILSQSGGGLDWADGFAVRLRTRVVRSVYSPHITRGKDVVVRYGETRLTVVDGRSGLRAERTIQAARQDAGWQWEERGKALPFEDEHRYDDTRVGRRFDYDLLNQYCRALGIARHDPFFYGPRATLVDSSRQIRGQTSRGMPSEQWRAHHSAGS